MKYIVQLTLSTTLSSINIICLGKLNEIAYEPIKWSFLSTPVKICKDDQDDVKDLNQIFSYSFSQCVDAVLQKALIAQCNCLSSLWPRHLTPNEKYPYCSNFWHGTIDDLAKRLICTINFMSSIKEKKKSAQMKDCFPRCNFFTYSNTLSITKWLPSLEKLNRINVMQTQLELLETNRDNNVSIINFQRFLESSVNINDTELGNDSLEEDRFTYIQLIRKTKNTTIKKEKLVLDAAILLSRIGGLCSLFIGLTVAFFIEIVEFVYLLFHMRDNAMLAHKDDVDNVNNVSLWVSGKRTSNRSRRGKYLISHAQNVSCSTNNGDPLVEHDECVPNDQSSDNEPETVIWRFENSRHCPVIQESDHFMSTIISHL